MKKRIYNFIITLAVCFFCVLQNQAQANLPEYSKSLSLAVNSDAFAGLELGYTRRRPVVDFPFSYYARLNIPLLSSIEQKKFDTWEIKAGATMELIKLNRFSLLTDASIFSIRHKQSLGTFLPIGVNLELTPAYRTRKGYIGFQAMFKQVFCTYIRHSEYVKERFGEIYDSDGNLVEIAPQNGLYRLTGNHLYYGVEGMSRLSGKLEMYYDLGLISYLSPYTGMFDSMMFGQIPFYANLRFEYLLDNK